MRQRQRSPVESVAELEVVVDLLLVPLALRFSRLLLLLRRRRRQLQLQVQVLGAAAVAVAGHLAGAGQSLGGRQGAYHVVRRLVSAERETKLGVDEIGR